MEEKDDKKEHKSRMRHFLVLQHLMRFTDENNTASATDILDYLFSEYKIIAERRSIYKDIEEINILMYMLENDVDFFEAQKELTEDEDGEFKSIVYDKNRKGFYLKRKY